MVKAIARIIFVIYTVVIALSYMAITHLKWLCTQRICGKFTKKCNRYLFLVVGSHRDTESNENLASHGNR